MAQEAPSASRRNRSVAYPAPPGRRAIQYSACPGFGIARCAERQQVACRGVPIADYFRLRASYHALNRNRRDLVPWEKPDRASSATPFVGAISIRGSLSRTVSQPLLRNVGHVAARATASPRLGGPACNWIRGGMRRSPGLPSSARPGSGAGGRLASHVGIPARPPWCSRAGTGTRCRILQRARIVDAAGFRRRQIMWRMRAAYCALTLMNTPAALVQMVGRR